MDFENILKEIKNIIRKYLSENDFQLFLFGSWAKGRAHPTSDIDIAISGRKKIPWDIMVKILREADEIPTLRSIDIVDLNTKGENYKKNILEYAKIIS